MPVIITNPFRVVSGKWDVSSPSFVGNSPSASSIFFGRGGFLSSDGSKAYIIDSGGDRIVTFNLSTNWDISTATQDAFLFSTQVGGLNTAPQGMFFRDDGMRLYTLGDQDVNNFNGPIEWTLSTAFDLSTATHTGNTFNIAEDTTPRAMYVRPDGTKVYIIGDTNDTVYQYTLGTPWDLSTISYDSVSKLITSEETSPTGLFFKNDGTKMFVGGLASDAVSQYTLSIPWDVSTASYDSVQFNHTSQFSNSGGMFFRDDGNKLYLVSDNSPRIYEYDL